MPDAMASGVSCATVALVGVVYSLVRPERGIPDLIEEGRNGLLCNPADDADLAEKINSLLESDLKSLGAYSRQMVENDFAWPQIARRTLAAYETVI